MVMLTSRGSMHSADTWIGSKLVEMVNLLHSSTSLIVPRPRPKTETVLRAA
jgi:hypothetical protein